MQLQMIHYIRHVLMNSSRKFAQPIKTLFLIQLQSNFQLFFDRIIHAMLTVVTLLQSSQILGTFHPQRQNLSAATWLSLSLQMEMKAIDQCFPVVVPVCQYFATSHLEIHSVLNCFSLFIPSKSQCFTLQISKKQTPSQESAAETVSFTSVKPKDFINGLKS